MTPEEHDNYSAASGFMYDHGGEKCPFVVSDLAEFIQNQRQEARRKAIQECIAIQPELPARACTTKDVRLRDTAIKKRLAEWENRMIDLLDAPTDSEPRETPKKEEIARGEQDD